MKALVMAGGEIKGAYEAGALHYAATMHGYVPDLICGTSVGALNALFLAGYMGAHPNDPFEAATRALLDVWTDEVTGHEVLATKRSIPGLAWDLVRGKPWRGLWDMAPLGVLCRRLVDERVLFRSPIPAYVAVVSLRTTLVDHWPCISIDAALASAAIPLLMPGVPVVGQDWYDGGCREIAPLLFPIRHGATDILALVPTPEVPARDSTRTLPGLVGRLLATMTNEIVTNDLQRCRDINADVAANRDLTHRQVNLTVVRPSAALPFDIFHFTPTDITRMIDQGMTDAEAVLGAPDA